MKRARTNGPSVGEELAAPGLRAFFRVCVCWKLTPEQQFSLLGKPDRDLVDLWRRGFISSVPRDVLMRVSYVLGIYKALHQIFPDDESADRWISRQNLAPMFSGGSALNFILDENDDSHLKMLRQYLDAQIN